MAKKPQLRPERIEVIYDEQHWEILHKFRLQAIRIMESLERANIHSIIHGSIARGDVTLKSDIDIFIPMPLPSLLVELALEKSNFSIYRRILIQATPSYAIKGYIEVNEQNSVSFPLVKLKRIERDFYKFGGELTLQELKENRRALGVDKRLMLIEPTSRGHVESGIIGREDKVAALLGIGVDVVLDRVRALRRRNRIGRTGLFVERELTPKETFESVLKHIINTNPAVRRRLRVFGNGT